MIRINTSSLALHRGAYIWAFLYAKALEKGNGSNTTFCGEGGCITSGMGRGLFVGCLSSTGVLPRPETFDDMRVLDLTYAVIF